MLRYALILALASIASPEIFAYWCHGFYGYGYSRWSALESVREQGSLDGATAGTRAGNIDGQMEAMRAAEKLGIQNGRTQAKTPDPNDQAFLWGRQSSEKAILHEAFERGRDSYSSEKFSERVEVSDEFSNVDAEPISSIEDWHPHDFEINSFPLLASYTPSASAQLMARARVSPHSMGVHPQRPPQFVRPSPHSHREHLAPTRHFFPSYYGYNYGYPCWSFGTDDFRTEYWRSYRLAYQSAYLRARWSAANDKSTLDVQQHFEQGKREGFQSAHQAIESQTYARGQHAAEAELRPQSEKYQSEFQRGRKMEEDDFALRPVRLINANSELQRGKEELFFSAELRNFSDQIVKAEDLRFKLQALNPDSGSVIRATDVLTGHDLRKHSRTLVHHLLAAKLKKTEGTQEKKNATAYFYLTVYYKDRVMLERPIALFIRGGLINGSGSVVPIHSITPTELAGARGCRDLP